jgi:3-oxoacyl-[acyl-carrier-protein] synthase-1
MQIKLPIASLGLVTALGDNVTQCAAGQRAGLSLARGLPDFMVEGPLDDDDNVEVAATGHTIGPLTEGFLPPGLWLRIGSAALADLLRYGELPPASDTGYWKRTALFLVVPDVTGDRFGWPEPEVDTLVAGKYAEPLLALAEIYPTFQPGQIGTGHAGFAAAVCSARNLVGQGSYDRAVVLGVDSYVDPLSLGVLANEGRLKCDAAPTGLLPGEAGACVLVERQRRGRVEGTLLSACFTPSTVPAPGEDEARAAFIAAAGQALATAAATVLAEAGVATPFAGDLVLDLNGEEWRAHAWGAAQLRLQGAIDLGASNLVLPCESFGEIGAASGAAALCLATRAFARDYALGDHALLLSISENGDAGAVLVEKS